jgi:carotenoid cleavage dioxygenase
VVREVLYEGSQEFPRFDERLTGRPYRHAYTVGFDFDFSLAQQLNAYDLATGRHAVHKFGLGRIPSEAVFVPRAPDAVENDGWLVNYVTDMNTGTTDFVVLNAADVAGPPQAVVHLPVRVPLGFHGNWIPDPA